MMKKSEEKASQNVPMRDGGIQDGYLGTNYQFKLLDLYVHNAIEAGWKFELFTELSNAGKFDDLTLKIFAPDGTESFIFGQAKHKKNPDYLQYQTFINNHDFKLSDYYDSLNLIEENYENVESVLLITNHKIDDGQYKKEVNGLIKLPFNKQLSFYLIQDTSADPIYKDIGKRFKFPGEEFPTEHKFVLQILRAEFVARELVLLLLGKSAEPQYCRPNRKFLFEKIFDDKAMLRDEFLNGTDPDLHVFRSVFENASNSSIKINQSGRKNNCWEYWKQQKLDQKVKLIETPGDAEEDQKKFDAQLKRFVEKFELITSLEVAHIEKNIQESMQKKQNLQDVSSHYQVLTTNVKDWYTGPNKKSPLTKEIYHEFFRRSEFELQKKVVMNLKDTLSKDWYLEFKEEVPEIKSFYENQHSKQVLHVITPESEESFISMRVLSMLSSAPRDSIVMISTCMVRKMMEQGLNVFKSGESCKLLILQIDPEKPLSEDDEKKLEEALQDRTKRVILISDQKWKNKIHNIEVIQTTKTFLTDLTKESLNKVLEIQIKFQNSSVAWRDLMDEKHSAETSLADLINTKSVAENILVPAENNQELYVSRTFTYKNVLRPEVLKECRGDVFVYSEEDFEAK
jgi:hypothetical protein